MEGGGKSTLSFTHGAAKKYGISPTTYDRTIKELVAKGFLERIENDNLAQLAPNQFRLIIAWRTKPAPKIGEGSGQNIPHGGEGNGKK